jgi:hypothetical protein
MEFFKRQIFFVDHFLKKITDGILKKEITDEYLWLEACFLVNFSFFRSEHLQ